MHLVGRMRYGHAKRTGSGEKNVPILVFPLAEPIRPAGHDIPTRNLRLETAAGGKKRLSLSPAPRRALVRSSGLRDSLLCKDGELDSAAPRGRAGDQVDVFLSRPAGRRGSAREHADVEKGGAEGGVPEDHVRVRCRIFANLVGDDFFPRPARANISRRKNPRCERRLGPGDDSPFLNSRTTVSSYPPLHTNPTALKRQELSSGTIR